MTGAIFCTKVVQSYVSWRYSLK